MAETEPTAPTSEQPPQKLLEVKNLKTHFFTGEGVVRAVDGVSYHIGRGEVLGIVGESGSGKSVSSLSTMRLIPDPPGRIVDGSILFSRAGKPALDLAKASEPEMRKIRGNHIGMIFQDPMTSLNPYLRVSRQLTEVLELHKNLRGSAARDRGIEMLKLVGIPDPMRRFDDYPHQLSGGMRQRVMIAMALLCDPELLIADEPTTALDVTIQAQILELIAERRDLAKVGVILITHDLGVVARLADRVAVMYAGRIVEQGPIDAIFHDPQHPYTVGLARSIPRLDENEKRRLVPIQGMPPSLSNLPSGCPFRTRCRNAMPVCAESYPAQRVVQSNDPNPTFRANISSAATVEHLVSCHEQDVEKIRSLDEDDATHEGSAA